MKNENLAFVFHGVFFRKSSLNLYTSEYFISFDHSLSSPLTKRPLKHYTIQIDTRTHLPKNFPILINNT